ncbi:MgtC/SapB family protein [Flavihumibacter petaseus]|uniref:MgtC family protein n=1 Tax=Flavihumibacter petaseus NBRC 106054 TaxID=1220578 RepID=A0A0E9N481_9BACT|nr:MgtC/SapB family protein [Flavihumibacter petaseus]GAO44634.1 MgtC family protein [Flavihumibacter petaseus NBRC 106054]
MENEVIIRFLIAALWGGVVGLEREFRSKAAGFRTMILISVGACLFTMLSMYIGAPASPDRIASNIVTGIGFLGAGVIFRGTDKVNGITTAATIWAVAAVGMGIGAGRYVAAASASVLMLIILAVLPYFEKLIDKLNQSRSYTVICKYSSGKAAALEAQFAKLGMAYKANRLVKEGDLLTLRWTIQGTAAKHQRLFEILATDPDIRRFEY